MPEPEPASRTGRLSRNGPVRYALTERGWALLLLAATFTLGGLLFHIGELFPLAAAALVLVAGAAAWVRKNGWAMDSHRQLHPARVPQGAPAHLQLSMANTGKRPSPALSASDRFGSEYHSTHFALAPLAPGAVAATSYRLPTDRRGLFRVGPLELRLQDPFGLASAARIAPGHTALCVHPSYDRLPPLDLRELAADGGAQAGGARRPDGEEFYSLRDYRSGDDIRRVHWPSSARRGQLMIREAQAATSGRLLLVGDLRPQLHTSVSFESVLKVLAALADAALRGGHSVRLACTGGADSRWGDGPGHRAAILDLLAEAAEDRAGGAQALHRCLWPSGNRTPVVVATTDKVADADLARPPGAATPAGGRRLLVAIERDGGGQVPRPSGWAVLPVPAGASFAVAWSRRPMGQP